MRKVDNKRAVRSLSDKSFRANRTRNRIAVLAIALTAMLFTTLFTIGIGTVQNFQQQTMRSAGGDSHGTIKNLTREQYDKLSKHTLIKESAPCMIVSDYIRNPEFLKRHVEAWFIPEYHYPHCFIEIVDGKVPGNPDEILLDDVSLRLLGLDAKAGQKVTLDMQLRMDSEEITERTFTVSGVIKSDPAMNVGFAIVPESYLDKYQSELTYQNDISGSNTGAIRMDVGFSNSFSIQKKLDQVIEESGYSTDESDENYIASNANWAYVSDGVGADSATVGALAGGLVLIMITGYLIIYNVFQISIMKDIRYYGLLKTIGTTGRQIKKILRRQALRLCLFGIPAGLIAGFFAGKWIVPLVVARSSYDIQEVNVSANPVIFVAAAVFALITVLISEGRPARLAARVSPVEAVRYTEGGVKRKSPKKSTGGGKIRRMALSNLGRNKGKTVVIILSLSLSVILLNSVFTVTSAFDMNTFLEKFMVTDFQIGNAKYFGMDGYHGGSVESAKEENLTESFIGACESRDGFEDGGRIYSTGGQVGVLKDSVSFPDSFPRNEAGEPGSWYGKEFIPIAENGRGDYRAAFHGLDDFVLSVIDVWKGEKDPDTIREKLASGNYLLVAVPVDDNGVVIEKEVKHKPGDTITLTYKDGEKRDFKILSLIKDNYWNLTNRWSTDFRLYVSSDVFKEMASEQFLMTYLFNVAGGRQDETEQFLKTYTSDTEPLMDYNSRIKYVKEFSSMKGLFILVGGMLSVVIGLIGILNFVNTILTGIVTRKREFAMMEAIGMTRKQLSLMTVTEGVYYAAFTCIFSVVFGCLFSLSAIRVLTGGMWFMKYHFVIWPMLIVLPVMLLLGVVVPKIVFHFQAGGSIVEQLKEDE